ncbi:MAG TPA: hypothetical protein VFB66_15300 [Tepidisphaeraceae bacterium]|nr:hypothetical protein [Tepidisphaeraceae bacterium]
MASRCVSRFTPTDLVVTLFVASVVASAMLLPAIARLGSSDGRLRCAANLRQIGQGIQMYMNENKGAFPRARFDGAGGEPTEFTGWDAASPFDASGPGPNDVTAAMFLLLRTQDLTSEVFVCPFSQAERWDFAGKAVQDVSNFPGPQYLSYSLCNPYASPPAAAAGFTLDDAAARSFPPQFAVAADINPGPPDVLTASPNSPRGTMRLANSRNHDGDGQNVLHADGHVEYHTTPFCGMTRTGSPPYRDNVYTFGAGYADAPGIGVRGSPADGLDSVLLPTGLAGPLPPLEGPLASVEPSTWIMIGLLAAILLCVSATLVLALRRNRGVSRSPNS